MALSAGNSLDSYFFIFALDLLLLLPSSVLC